MKTKNLKFKIPRGFSLIELVFAMSFLTIIILGVISLQSANLAMMNRQKHEIQAHFYANQGLKIAEALGYADLDTDCPSRTCKFDNPDADYTVEDAGEDFELIDGLYDRLFTLDPAGLKDGFKAECKVTWTDGTGDHEVTAKRIIYQ